MKNALVVVGLMLGLVGVAGAWSTKDNPDRYPSLGFDLIKGQQAGIPKAGVNGVQTNGGLVGAKVDYRLPVTSAFTFHAGAESVGINNNLGYTDGYRLEIGGRVYFRD